MGKVKRYLFQGERSEKPVMYADKRSLELSETMHFHERNIRLEYSGNEFVKLIEAFIRAGDKWRSIGSIGPRMERDTTYLDLSSIEEHPKVTPTRFEIEESTYPTLKQTTIHLHYGHLRIEFTHAEWEEFARGVGKAVEEWKT